MGWSLSRVVPSMSTVCTHLMFDAVHNREHRPAGGQSWTGCMQEIGAAAASGGDHEPAVSAYNGPESPGTVGLLLSLLPLRS